ncbi:MAG: TetR/AcrR family transcriptional regulator [Gemmatimonadota bacterium]
MTLTNYDTLAFRNWGGQYSRMEPNGKRPGRPRSAKAHAAILQAAFRVIRDVGYDAASIDGIAAQAGVGKTTVYRRWSTKEELVVEALEDFAVSLASPGDGSMREQLRAVLHQNMRMYNDPATAPLLTALVAAMPRSTQIAAAFRGGFVAARRNVLRRVVEHGIAAGDLHAGSDIDLILDLLSGPMAFRGLITGDAIDERLVNDTVDAVMRAFQPSNT